MQFLFNSCQKIRQSKEFELAFKSKGLTNKWFTIYLVDNLQKYPRLGMVVSKSIMSDSVSRNYAKRLIRELFRLNASSLPPQNFVIRIRRKLTRATSFEAREALFKLITSTSNL